MWYFLLVTDPLKIFLSMKIITYLVLLGLPVAIRILFAMWDKETDLDLRYAIFLTVWFLGSIYSTSKGIRFVILLVPAYAIAFGILVLPHTSFSEFSVTI